MPPSEVLTARPTVRSPAAVCRTTAASTMASSSARRAVYGSARRSRPWPRCRTSNGTNRAGAARARGVAPLHGMLAGVDRTSVFLLIAGAWITLCGLVLHAWRAALDRRRHDR